MKGIALCNKGIEDIAALEIRELIGAEFELKEGYVLFDFSKNEDLCRLSYMCQSVRKVLRVLHNFNYNDENDIIKNAQNLGLAEWLNENKSFKVDAESADEKIDAENIKGKIGEQIINSIKEYKQTVNLSNPDIIIFFYASNNQGYLCIDFSAEDLSKRTFRIYSHPASIKATIAYAMVRISDYNPKNKLMDPFCMAGGIPIETALFANKHSVRFFDKDEFYFKKFTDYDFPEDKKLSKDKGEIYCIDAQFRNVDASKKNAKIAGIHKAINFSRLEAEWLDTKFDEGSIDKIVTCLPNISKMSDEASIKKVLKEFFYQAEFILNKKGNIVACTKNPEVIKNLAMQKGFSCTHEREVFQGGEKLNILKLERKS